MLWGMARCILSAARTDWQHRAAGVAADDRFPDEGPSARGLRLPDVLTRRLMTRFPAADDLVFRPEAPALVAKLLSQGSLRQTDSSTQLG
jgi:hypothetical protein